MRHKGQDPEESGACGLVGEFSGKKADPVHQEVEHGYKGAGVLHWVCFGSEMELQSPRSCLAKNHKGKWEAFVGSDLVQPPVCKTSSFEPTVRSRLVVWF